MYNDFTWKYDLVGLEIKLILGMVGFLYLCIQSARQIENRYYYTAKYKFANYKAKRCPCTW